MAHFILVAFALVVHLTVSTARTASVIRSANSSYTVVDGRVKGAVAWAYYNQTVNSTGWAFLELHTSPDYADTVQAYGAGYLEGYLTAPLIRDTYLNTQKGSCEEMGADVCRLVMNYIKENLKWMTDMIETNPRNPYWYQIKLVLEQLEGLAGGYQQTSEPLELTSLDFLLLGVHYDLDALSSAVVAPEKRKPRQVGTGSCSALIKILHDSSDVLFAHDTWTEYKTMLRIYKMYDLQFTSNGPGTRRIPGGRIAFSSYPMSVFSGDDFYTIGSGLAVMETTNGNYNDDLWKYVRANATVLNLFRCIAANRLATTAEEWTSTYIMYNSGTYNNQWMVFDYNKFERYHNPQPGAFFVLEQLPGNYEVKDMTSTLIKKGYWSSYNIPYFQHIFDLSGYPANVKKYGDFFTWSLAPRALIFDRDHSRVQDMTSALALMRYNDFRHDPLSKCSCSPPYSGENGIAARSDLNPADGQYPFSALGHRMHGATDAKITSSSLIRSLSAVIQSGPTFSQLPAFQWSTSGETKPLGHPDLWEFEPVIPKWEEP